MFIPKTRRPSVQDPRQHQCFRKRSKIQVLIYCSCEVYPIYLTSLTNTNSKVDFRLSNESCTFFIFSRLQTARRALHLRMRIFELSKPGSMWAVRDLMVSILLEHCRNTDRVDSFDGSFCASWPICSSTSVRDSSSDLISLISSGACWIESQKSKSFLVGS